MRRTWTNWAGNQTCAPSRWDVARSIEDVCDVVADANRDGRHVKVVGSGHSFTAAAVARDVLLDVAGLSNVGAVDSITGEVEVGAGITIARLNDELAHQGRALANLGDIAYQTIAGAVSTATHGTGVRLTGLAGQLTAITVVDGSGCLRTFRADDPDPSLFRAAQVGVGALGVIVSLRIRTVPAFTLHAIEEPRSLTSVLSDLDALVEGNDHFEFFWMPHTEVALTKRNNRTDAAALPLSSIKHWYQRSFLENTAFGAVCALGRAVPAAIPALAKVVAASGRLDYSDASHKVFASPRRVRFLEMEYAIPRDECRDALSEVRSMIERSGIRVNFPIEVRFTAADDALLSTAHARESAYIAVHAYRGMPHEEYFRAVGTIMSAHAGRPHWGKMHYLENDELAGLYPRWGDFLDARRLLDPTGTFENDYVRRVFGSCR